MNWVQVLLAIIFPPLAVYDRGCSSIFIVLLLTLCGWIPGVIGALIILNKNN
ncbi:MAG: YqaE/Pmp3 family membrane protein [Paludibacteraceae bacterium]|nr:YqaE/Pmp3 family membrane protein [Paludibacteraceae bacterium]